MPASPDRLSGRLSSDALKPLIHPRQARIEICEPVEHFAVVLRHFRAKKVAHIVNP
jgi:hypothetical protein